MYLICMKGYYNMDLTSPRTIRNIQEQFGFTFKKGLGQNFLTARNILEEIVDAAEIESGVIEVGPGFGVLTSELAQNSDKVVTIEIDERLIDVLDYTLAEYNYDLVDKASVRNIVENYGGELVMTGRNPDEWFCERADYISEIKKIKHPYDKGIVAREGIEY